MANRDCNGDFFIADGARYYRCLWEGKVLYPAPQQGDECSSCARIIEGTETGEAMVKTIRIAILPPKFAVEAILPNELSSPAAEGSPSGARG
jgi:hypothetical protein